LPVSHSFVMLAYFYTNFLEYYVPRVEVASCSCRSTSPRISVRLSLTPLRRPGLQCSRCSRTPICTTAKRFRSSATSSRRVR
jgi:hypothetical protein